MKLYGSIIGFYILLAATCGFMVAGFIGYIEHRAFINIIYNQPPVVLTEIKI